MSEQEAVNVNFEKPTELNNKAMRLSKLQKWILLNAREADYEGGKHFFSANGKFQPSAYFILLRTEITQAYFKQPSDSAEVVLTRSLKAMEEHGLIIRRSHCSVNLEDAVAMRYAMKPDARKLKPYDEQVKEIKEFQDEVERLGGPKRRIHFLGNLDFGSKTKIIALTEKGIELRKRLIKVGDCVG